MRGSRNPSHAKRHRRPAHSIPAWLRFAAAARKLRVEKQKRPGALSYEQRQQQQVWTQVVT